MFTALEVNDPVSTPIQQSVHLYFVDVDVPRARPATFNTFRSSGPTYEGKMQDIVAIDPLTGAALKRWAWFEPRPSRAGRRKHVTIDGVRYLAEWRVGAPLPCNVSEAA